MTTKAGRRRRAERSSPKRRTLLGDDSWFEVFSKVVTVATLGFGVWAYFNSVEPVFEVQRRLREESQRATQMSAEVVLLKKERSALQQQLDEYQRKGAAYRHGIELAYLLDFKRELAREALAQRQAPEGFDLRRHSLSYLAAVERRLGKPAEGSIASSRAAALQFCRRYVERNVPAGASDPRLLDGIITAYERQSQGGGAPRPPP